MALFYFVVSTFPFALYLLALAWLHARAVPTVISGRRDFVALCLSLSGVFFIGPGQLLVTWGAAAVWKNYTWLLIALFCFLVVVLIASNLRPKIVVYNAAAEALRKTITTTALTLDDEACWNGASLNMPGLGVQFYLETAGIGRVATLVRIGSEKSLEGWNRFAVALNAALKKLEKSKNKTCCVILGLIGASLLTADVVCVLKYYDALRETASFYLSL